MSAETVSSASPASAAPVQGANPVPKLESRGERDFATQLEEFGKAAPVQAGDGKAPTLPTKTADQVGAPDAATTATATTSPTAVASATDSANAKMVASVVEATIAGMTKKDAAVVRADERDLTPQEFNAKYGVPSINEATMQAILDADPKKGAAALQNLIQSAVRQSLLMARDLYGAEITKVRGEFEPDVKEWRSYRAQQAEERLAKQFYTDNKDLVGEEPLVEEMTAAIKARVDSGQMRFTTQADANKAVAEATRKLLARMQRPAAAGSQQTNASGAAAPAPATRQMSAASSAGRSGTGQTQEKNIAEQVFGEFAR